MEGRRLEQEFGIKLLQRDFILQESRLLISVYYIIMLLISYIMVVWATMLREPTGIDHGQHWQKSDSSNIDGSEQVAIVAYASTLAMVINLVVVYLFVVCMGQKKQGYVSV